MSSPISALPSAVGWPNTAFITGIDSGINYKIQRNEFLAVGIADNLNIVSAGGGSFNINGAGTVQIGVPAGQEFDIQWNLNNAIHLDAFGNLYMYGQAGGIVSMTGNGGQVYINGAGGIVISSSLGTAVAMAFVESTPGTFSGGCVDVWDAINRIGIALALSIGHAIP